MNASSADISMENWPGKIKLDEELHPELEFLHLLDEGLQDIRCSFIEQGSLQLLANKLEIKLTEFPNKRGRAKRFRQDPIPFYVEFIKMPAVADFLAQVNDILVTRASSASATIPS